jgi:AcrR family transcriptional regulator
MSGAERREGILVVARRLFAQQGYHGTSTAEIAAAAGCSEAVLYRHFPSKQALFAAVLVRSAAQMQGHLRRALAEHVDDPLSALATAFARTAADPDAPDHLRLRSLAVAVIEEPEIRVTLDALHRGSRDLLVAAARASQASGHARADVPPEHLAQLFSGLGFMAAFACALGGPDQLGRIASVAESFLTLARPARTSTTVPEDP